MCRSRGSNSGGTATPDTRQREGECLCVSGGGRHACLQPGCGLVAEMLPRVPGPIALFAWGPPPPQPHSKIGLGRGCSASACQLQPGESAGSDVASWCSPGSPALWGIVSVCKYHQFTGLIQDFHHMGLWLQLSRAYEGRALRSFLQLCE